MPSPASERKLRYAADVGALARKDLLLELRAKETLPSMLLFVLSALTIFHFALPHGTGHQAALGLLWAALIFTALLGLTRAFVAEREQGMFDALVLAPCDRSTIWLGKSIAELAILTAAEDVALPVDFEGLEVAAWDPAPRRTFPLAGSAEDAVRGSRRDQAAPASRTVDRSRINHLSRHY